MNAPTFTQRINSFSHDEAVQACSDIGYMVSRSGLSGIQALQIERRFYTVLYEEVCALNASPAALEYIENRRKSVSAQLDMIRSCEPDLFDDYLLRNSPQALRETAAI